MTEAGRGVEGNVASGGQSNDSFVSGSAIGGRHRHGRLLGLLTVTPYKQTASASSSRTGCPPKSGCILRSTALWRQGRGRACRSLSTKRAAPQTTASYTPGHARRTRQSLLSRSRLPPAPGRLCGGGAAAGADLVPVLGAARRAVP